MVKNSFIHHLTKVLIDIMFYGGIAACIALPFLLSRLMGYIGHSDRMFVPNLIVLLLSGIFSVYIAYQLKAMFKTLLGGNPFVVENVSCLRKCAVASALISIVYLVRILIWFTISSTVIALIFVLLALFLLTLKDVFKQAIAYKEENDWTV